MQDAMSIELEAVERWNAHDREGYLALFDEAVAWLVARGQTGQWGSTPFSAIDSRVAAAAEWAASGGLRIADEGRPEKQVRVPERESPFESRAPRERLPRVHLGDEVSHFRVGVHLEGTRPDRLEGGELQHHVRRKRDAAEKHRPVIEEGEGEKQQRRASLERRVAPAEGQTLSASSGCARSHPAKTVTTAAGEIWASSLAYA